MNKTVTGPVKRHPDGYGFLVPHDKAHPDVFIARHQMEGVMMNDVVEAEVFQKSGDDRFYGKVVSVLERGLKKVVGRYKKKSNGDGLLEKGAADWGGLLHISYNQSRGAVNGDWVAVEITKYPEDDERLEGRVSEILGEIEDPTNDIRRILHLQNITEHFSTEAKRQLEPWGDEVQEKDMKGRKDLRDLPLITIDGVTAKDFDDAVCVQQNASGFRVWVAIADVSHYVPQGSPLDREAYDRGTSVYFPGFVVPMLPEALSNHLCSLRPKVNRLALVCEAQLGFDGEVMESQVYEAVIYSHARVTYGEAQDILSGDVVHEDDKVQKNIQTASDLAQLLMAKRFKEGSLDLDIPESEVILNEAGEPIDIVKSERVFSHRLIEELMLLANVCVAKLLHQTEKPSVYRIHETPEEENIQGLERFLKNSGQKAGLKGGHLQKKLTKCLKGLKGQAQGQVLSVLTLRSMKQAKYSTQNVGHFGLGFEHYSHFTSPIRRYPDLMVHRLLKRRLLNLSKYKESDEDSLETACQLLSACEQRAVKAERQVLSIKKARFMVQHVGSSFKGVISSVVKFGVFVTLQEFDVDGLVKKDLLGKDHYEFDEDNLLLRGRKSGHTYKMGDEITVQVAAADIEEGRIDFVLEGGLNGDHKKASTNKKNSKKRSSSKKHTKDSSKARVSRRRSKKRSK